MVTIEGYTTRTCDVSSTTGPLRHFDHFDTRRPVTADGKQPPSRRTGVPNRSVLRLPVDPSVGVSCVRLITGNVKMFRRRLGGRFLIGSPLYLRLKLRWGKTYVLFTVQ